MNIAIIGASGMLGCPVTHELIKAGLSVRIVARDVEKMRLLFPNTTVVAGDLRNKQSLLDALRGIDTVYLNLSIRQTENETGGYYQNCLSIIHYYAV